MVNNTVCFNCNNNDPYLIEYLGDGVMFCNKCCTHFNVQGTGMSKGREIIGEFNCINKTEINQLKSKAVELVDLIEEFGRDERRKQLAIDSIEYGTMMAVKSIFN